MATLLADLVAASDRAAETSSRLAKRDAIAEVLRGAAPDEVEIAVAWLAGEARQGRIGVGWATLAALRGTPAAEPQLTLGEVDGALAAVAATAGKGSAAGAPRSAASVAQPTPIRPCRASPESQATAISTSSGAAPRSRSAIASRLASRLDVPAARSEAATRSASRVAIGPFSTPP